MKKLKNIIIAVLTLLAVILCGCGIYAKKAIDNFSLLAKNNINPAFYGNYPAYLTSAFIAAAAAVVIFFVPFLKKFIIRYKEKRSVKSGNNETKSIKKKPDNDEPDYVYDADYVVKEDEAEIVSDDKLALENNLVTEDEFICECGCPLTKDMQYCPDCGKKVKGEKNRYEV